MPSPDPYDLPAPLLDAALTRLAVDDGPAREAILAELVAAHPEHAERLRALGGALRDAARLLAQGFASPAPPEEPVQIDCYRVLRRLGEGAFGVVYLCAQDAPIRRQVAVKVLRPGAGDCGTLQRFAAERQLLATFQHPAIAGVIDAGTLPDGRPYFAMEYIDGVPITDYCDQRRLPVEARLLLFLDLCEGVEHAHARGIVHRDLKPQNVLVTECDGKAMPKIIDFGVAKALHGTAAADGGSATAPGRVVGTPGYMSPEQANGDPAAIDARTDVFALGVLLFELLTGSLPWGRGATSTTTEPPRPSTRVHGETRVAAARATAPRVLAGRLRGELDWIVLAALHPQRELRYPGARELAADVRHHLHDEPVRARPPSLGYRLRKQLRRHRAGFAVAAAVAMAGLGIAGTWAFRRDALASETARLVAIEDAVRKLLARSVDPRLQDAPHSDDMRKDMLRDALALHDRVLQERSASPELRELRLQALNGIADMHFWLAQYRASLAMSVEAEREAESLLLAHGAQGRLQFGHAIALRNLARCHIVLGNRAEAAACSDRAIGAWARLLESDPVAHAPIFANTLVERATLLHREHDHDGALAAQRRAIAVLGEYLEARPGDGDAVRDLVRFRCGLGGMLIERGQAQEAEAVVAAAQVLAERSHAVTDDERAIVLRRVASLHRAGGRRREEADALTTAIDLTAGVLQKHPGWKGLFDRLRELRTQLGEALYAVGEAEAADRVSELAVGDAESLGPDYPSWQNRLADTLGRLAWAAVSAQRLQRLEELDLWLQRALDATAAVEDRFGRAARARAFVTRGFVCRDLGRPFSVGQWEDAVAEARQTLPDLLPLAQIELARRRREVGELAGAGSVLAELSAAGQQVPAWRFAREASLLAIATGDAPAAARAAAACLEQDGGWTGLQVAAQGFTAAGKLARQTGGAEAGAWIAQAITLWERAIPALEAASEPWPTARLRSLFVAQARTQLACLGPGSARELLAEALPELDRQRGAVEVSWWDEALWVEGHAIVIRDDLARGESQRARERLTELDAALQDPHHLVTATRLWAELASAARRATPPVDGLAEAAEAAALSALRRAIASGFRDRRLLEGAELASLRAHPAFRELVAAMPD